MTTFLSQIRDLFARYGWLAALLTIVILLAALVGAALLLGVDVAGLIARWTGG